MKPISVVLSGFDPYPDLAVNPCKEVPQALAGEHVIDDAAVEVTPVVLPVSFELAWPILERTLKEVTPDIVIATGFKHSTRGIAMERCAVNHVDSRRADALNVVPERGPIDPEGPAAFWTRLPLRAILGQFATHGIAATLSSDAGTFVCNALFYDLLKWASDQRKVLAGFVSFPVVVESDTNHHGLTMDRQIKAGFDVVEQSARYWTAPPNDDTLLKSL